MREATEERGIYENLGVFVGLDVLVGPRVFVGFGVFVGLDVLVGPRVFVGFGVFVGLGVSIGAVAVGSEIFVIVEVGIDVGVDGRGKTFGAKITNTQHRQIRMTMAAIMIISFLFLPVFQGSFIIVSCCFFTMFSRVIILRKNCYRRYYYANI